MVSRYVNAPVKPEICLLPPPHYRMLPPQRAEFHGGSYVQQQQQPPNQITNQGPPLRGMAPTGPPTQASTPPNADLKVQQHVPQQQTMNLYPQRGQNYFQRPPQSNQPQRLINQRPNQPALYASHPSIQVPQYQVLNMPMPSYPAPYGGHGPTTFVQPYLQNYRAPAMFTQQYAPPPYYYNQTMQRQPQASVQPVAQGMPHTPQPPQAMATTAMTAPMQKKQPKKRSNAIPIVDPATMMPIDNEELQNPTSGESSARQTPQPAPHNSVKEVQATFAKQVAQAINKDSAAAEEEVVHDPHHGMDPAVLTQRAQIPPPQQQPAPFHQIPQNVHNRNDIAKSSKLQVPTNDFVPANNLSNTAKETPVVSAISNSAEVTIPGKPKDRESPAKGRKQRDTPAPSQKESAPHKDTPKEPSQPSIKEVSAPPSDVKPKEDKPKEQSPVALAPAEPPSSAKAVSAKEQPPVQQQQQHQPAVRDDKKHQQPQQTKKECSVAPVEIAGAQQPAVNQDNSGKSKQAQRGKDQPKQAGGQQAVGQNNKPPAPMPVANQQPQQAKSNKANKMKELNMKGASKEGTDMDAFSINAETTHNANDAPAQPAQTEPQQQQQQPPQPEVVTPVINETPVVPAKKIETSEALPIVKPESKPSFDVTAIVRELPKPFTPPPVVENCDETDKAALSNDKLVQAKNEVNAKTAISNDQSEIKPLQYEDDQWSPNNPEGKKSYGRDFLLALRTYPKSKTKPDNILNEVAAGDDRSRMGGDMGRGSAMGRTDFAPSFGNANFLGKSQSTRIPPKRNSQQGKPSGNSKGGKSGSMIRVSISFKEDVKLHESENAWKPARQNPNVVKTDDDRKTDDLYKKVRGVLNKLTPQKFSTLLNQIKTLPIDTTERLQGVIDLVFEKAVNEPNFSVAYALMCRELALMQVPVSAESKEFVNFRKLLVTRCQMEFEKNSSEESNRNVRLVEISACPDPEKKKEMMMALEENDRRIRMKSVGNIRFIGELFKQQMLTQNIMVRCLYNLIENEDEERLECLCKLLSTIGKDLEAKSVDLSKIFDQMRGMVDRKNGKVSSRVRFMLQDVIDLRSGGWVPRRTDLNPKTIEQIQKEADNEHMNIAAMNSGPMTPRKEDRNSSNSGKRRGGQSEDGWLSAPSSRGSKNTTFTVQSDKLKIQQPNVDEPLGSRNSFSNWSRGSNIKTAAPQSNSNKFALLDAANDNMDNRGGYRSSHKDAYSSKGNSMERGYSKFEGRNSRSGSQHRAPERERGEQRERESSQRNTPTPTQQPPQKVPAPQVYEDLTPEKLERRIKNIVDEYISDCANLEDTDTEVRLSINPTLHAQFVSIIITGILERSQTAREKVGVLCSHLLKCQTISLESYCAGLKEIFSSAEDLIVDIPQIWMYYAQVTINPIITQVLPLTSLHKCAECLQGHAHRLLAAIFTLAIKEQGPAQLASIWNSSGLTLNDWMDPSMVNEFITKNGFEFLTGGGGNPSASQSNLSYKEINDKLNQFVKSKASTDEVYKWITANVGEKEKENEFIRALATAYIKNSIVNDKLHEPTFRGYYSVLHRYIDSNSQFELQCLYAIQAIVNQLNHPSGLLLKIFNTLYEDSVISHDSFLSWEKSDDPLAQENKGVAVKQLTSFFTQLKETESENESGSSSED